jgi:hypothetical protein
MFFSDVMFDAACALYLQGIVFPVLDIKIRFPKTSPNLRK